MSNAWNQRLQQANAKASTQSGGSSAWEERLRQAEAASASQMETAAIQAAEQKAETINQIASANPYSLENLGPSPLQSNVQPGARASRNPYSDILSGLSQRQTAQPVERAETEPLAALQINRHDPLFEAQAQKKQAEQAAKDRIASRDTSDFMESVRTGMKEQPKEQAQPTQSRNLLAVNVDAERSKRENAEKMQDKIKDLQKVVNAYDATGIYDDRYAAYKFTLDEAQKEYDRLYSDVLKDQDIDQAEKLQRLAEIESVQGNSDYWGKTQYDPSLGSVSTYNPVTKTYETTGDLVYDIVNDRNGARGIDAANAAAMGADLAGLDLSRLKQMSADERRVYNYLYNTNGKEQADEYLQLLSSDLNARQMNEVTTWWRDYAAEHPLAASAASVVMSPMRGLSYLGQAGDMAMINKDEEGYYRTGLDQNAGYNRFSRIPSEIRNEVSQNIESKWGKEGSFLYQTGMSMADFITNAALSGNFLGNAPGSAAAAVSEALSLTIMGTGAAADATIAAKERGLDDDQSFALGTIAGVAEILTEKVSMESLLDLTHMDRNMIGYLLKNTLAEGSEEVGSDFINLFADIIVAKDESEWAKSVQEYKDRGMSEDKAFWAAFADQGKQMGMDFLGGAISGLAMASGSVTINQTAQAINNRRFENAIAQLREMDDQARNLDAQAAADAIAAVQENIQPGTEATPEQEAAPENLPQEASEQADVELAQQLAANGTDPAIISAITGLMPDQEGNWTGEAETQQMAQPAERTTTQAAEPADIVNGGLTNEVPVLGSSEWNDGARTGGQAGPVAESTGRAAENVATRARELGAVRAGRYAAATGEVRSTADLGIQNGIESKTLREVPYTADTELENIHQLTQAMGVDTVFLDHKMQIRNNGRVQNVNGAYDPSTNRIYVCVTDAKHTASALTMHEMYHAMQAANSALTATTWSALEQRFGKEYMDNRLMKTIEAYNGVYGLTDDDLHYYQEEVIADIYGGLNRGTLEVTPELQSTVMEIADQPHWSTPGEARAEARNAPQMLSKAEVEPEEQEQAEPEQEEKTRFSMSEPVEEAGTLIALHNLNERKARDMLRLGGLPAPSIAIVRADAGHDNFGDISMVFPRETIDPQANRKNRVYGSDAWTPTASNARVEYPINWDVETAFNKRFDELSSSVAGGLFRNSNILGSLGLQSDTSDMSVEEIARRLELREASLAAYLADTGRNIEPVVEEKQWNRTYGNDSLRKFIDAVGPVRLAQIEANFVQDMPMDQALGDDANIIRQIMWDYYRQSLEAFVRKQAKARGLNAAETEAELDRRANLRMEKVRDYAIEDFARDAWAYYEDNGRTRDEINKMDTLAELERATQGEDVRGWLEQQLQGLLGEPGVYNGKDIFTPSGNRRSFAALHSPYTAEGIVKAMYESTEGARGQNTFGTGARSLMSVATPEYRSVDEIHADEGRLRELDVDDYNSRVDALDDRITEFIRSVRRNNKAYSDNQFEEDNNIGTVLMDNAGQRTTERIRRGFAAEGYTLTPEQAEEARSIYAQAAEIPADYFEAKPERVVSFDEVLGVVAPDNAPEDLLEQMRAAGMDVLTYQHGNNEDRLAKVNSIPDVRFSVAEETEEETGTLDAPESDEAYEEQVAEVAPQVQYSLAYEENDQHISDLEKNYSKESAADLEDLKETTRNVTQMWRDIAATVNSSIVNEWNSRQGSDRVFTVFKAQMGYRYNAELSSMCKKGIPLFEAIDALVQKDTIKRLNTKTLGLEEKKILYELLQERGFEIPCAICFVEQSRQREGVLINNFLNGDDEGKLGWNNVLDDLERRMADAGVIFSFDNMSRDIATDRYNWRETAMPMTDAQQAAFEQALMDACNEELEKFNKTAKRPRKMLTSLSPSAIKASLGGSISSNLRIFKVLATEPQSRLRIDPSLLYSSYTTRNMAKSGNHNQLYTLFNSQGGVSGAKSKQRAEVYWGDVLKKKWSPSKVRDETGLRNQSNSDFQMITFLDQAQLYTDLTAKGYYLQAYTKTLTEAKLFGLSNAKINCSLIPAVRIYRNADGSVDVARTMETAGLDETGEPIYDDVEGINHNEYIMLRSIPEYSQSLGGTCIGYSDRHIEKLLDAEYVTQIIGYHDKTNDPKKRYRGATYAKNYNGENEAVDRNGKTVHLSFSEFLRKAEQRFQKTGEDFEGTTTYDGREWTANDIPKLAAQMYKDTCDQKGYSYAYPQFAEHENYYKLLVDFPVYDNQGNYAPHKKVNFQLPAQVPMRESDGSISWMDTAEFAEQNLRDETMVTERIAEEMAETGPDSLTEEFVRRANADQMRLSVADETEEELLETQDQQTRAQAEAMTQAQLEQRLRTDREQTEKYNLLRTEGMITPELERRAEIHDQATRIREQVLAEKRKGTGDNIDTQVDLTIRVGRKESARNLLRNLEQRKSALSMLPKAQQDTKLMNELNDGIERLKNHLREQNKSARQKIRKQREDTARNVRANESRTKLRDELLRSFSVEQSRRGQIGQLIDDFATRIQEQGRLSRDDRNRLFNELLDSGAVRVIEDDYAAEIRDQLRGTRVYVPQEVRDEWKGDFNEFRRRAWGAGLYLTSNPEDGSWDIHNAELAELYPGAFAEDETDAKIALENMLSAAENGKPVNMSLRDWLKLESGGSEEGTASSLRTMMEEMDAALNRFAGAQKIEVDMKARSIMEEAREALAMQERADRIRENRELSELKQQTMNSMRQLSRLRKKTSNANRAQIDAVIGNIDLLARHISPEGLENLQALEREYQARKEEMGDNFVPIDYVEERLGRLSKRHVDEMDAAELKELGRVVSGMITSIKNSQQMIGEENARMIADVATEWQDEVSNSKGMSTNLLNRWLKADQARPSTFLQMISGWRDGAGQLLARQLESGELKQLRFMQRASELFDPFTKENKDWLKKASGKNAEWITINGIDGVDAEGNGHVTSISITPMMRVALYMHANNYDNMRHIAEGGIRIPDQKLYQQGKVDEAYNRGKLVLLQPTDLYKILGGSPKTGDLGSNMTEQEKAFAKIMKRYMDGLSKEAINETSMELDGFERAMEANYYPIQTDRRFRKTQPDAVSHDISVENTGSIANERVHAANPVELRDATDTLAWHMEQTARYHGMAVPIRNLNAVYNYNFMREAGAGARYAGSLKNTIDQKWGGDASKYIEQLMADLQGGQSSEQSTFGQISAKLRGKLAGATLTLNPSVALSQAASYPAAMQQLGVKAMVRGLNLANRVDENLIAAYTPVLWYRAQGNITDELNKDNLKLPRALDWISEMDRATIKRLWAASEAWVQENTDLQKPESPAMDGSDPYYQRVADKFNRVVFDTQPNYTTMQRTQLQRQGNELTKILAMYKTVPLQYYNMMLEAQSRLQETSARAKAENATAADKKAYEEARQFATRTHTGLLISNAVYVLMKTVLMNALVRKRDDLKDDEGNTTIASAAEGIAWALAEVYAGSIIGSDVLMQAAKHLAKGDKFYGLELSSVSTINDLVEQGIDIGDVLKKVLTGTADLDDGLDAIHDAAAMTTRLLGIPAENVEKYLVSAMKWIAPEWANKYENLFDQIEKKDLKDGSSQRDLEAQISVLMENRTDDLQDETIQELARLWAAGYGNVIPTAIQNTATVNGEDITLTAKQKQAYRDAWSDPVTSSLQDLMDTDLYQDADDEQRQKMIASLYDYARGKAKEATLDVEPDAWIKAADESDMNLADYIAERVWLNSMAGNDDQSATEVKMEQLMAADMDDTLRAQTYRNVLASPSEKAALEAVGGTDADQVEAVNTLYKIRTATATDEQTAAEQKRNAILESDLTKEQQAELYYNLLADKDGKEWIDNVTAAGDDKADVVQALMNYQNASGTVEKIQTILDSDLSDEGKLELYHKITKERDERISTFKKAGLDLDDYLTITQKYSEINAGDESAGEKSTAFAKWLDDQKYTRNQIDTVKDEMGYYSQVRANSDKYDALTGAGLSSQNAQMIYESVNALKPEDGASQVSEIQKLEAIGNSKLSEKQKLEAAKVYASDSSDRKLDVLDGYSVSVSQWAEFRNLYAEYQEQYKGQKGANQSAAKDAAMDVIGSNISTQAGREAAAALWQTADTGWKAKNNPFDVSTGEAIYNAMH